MYQRNSGFLSAMGKIMKTLVVILSCNLKKSKSKDLDFFICVRRTQYHLTEGQHHFEQSEDFIPHLCGHKMMLRSARDALTILRFRAIIIPRKAVIS